MSDAKTAPRSRADWRKGRTAAIRDFLAEYAPGPNGDLLFQMLVTTCRLAADGVDRGELKVLNSALKELRYAFKVFSPYVDIPKVSIFGSARTPEDDPEYLQAKKFAELIQREGWMVITGAGDGIMRAGHHGASSKSSFGVSISLPGEANTNDFITDDPKLVNFKYFFTRKLLFVKEAAAIVLFPGGFGTQDEGFESLTLIQTGKAAPVPVILCDAPGGDYWKHWQAFVERDLLAKGMISEEDLALFFVTDQAELAVKETLQFYRTYHSSRFVGDRQVFRLNQPLSAESLAEINDSFADIIRQGQFEQFSGPLPEEDGVYPDKARLVFEFDRRSVGKLRMLINRINEES